MKLNPLVWNVKAPVYDASNPTVGAKLAWDIPEGVIDGKTQGLVIPSGYVLKKGTLLKKNSTGAFVPVEGGYEKNTLALSGDVTGTATKKVVLTIAGLTITTTSNVLAVNKLFALLRDVKAGMTGTAILAAYTAAGLTGFDSVTGTLTGYNIVTDEANKTLLFVARSYLTDVSNLSFTCVDTAASPVNLASSFTLTNLPLYANEWTSAILAVDVDTTSADKQVACYIEGTFYDNFIKLVAFPDEETVNSVPVTRLAVGALDYYDLVRLLVGTAFDVRQSGTAMV